MSVVGRSDAMGTGGGVTSLPPSANPAPANPPSAVSNVCKIALKILAEFAISFAVGLVTANIGFIPIVAAQFGLAGAIVFGVTGFGFTAAFLYFNLHSSTSSQLPEQPPQSTTPLPPPPITLNPTPPTTLTTHPATPASSSTSSTHTTPPVTRNGTEIFDPEALKEAASAPSTLKSPIAMPPETATLNDLLPVFEKAIAQVRKNPTEQIPFITALLPRLTKAADGKKCIDGHKIFSELNTIAKDTSWDNIKNVLNPLLSLIDLEACDSNGDTLLLRALKPTKDLKPQIVLIKTLLFLGADVQKLDRLQNNPLHLAAEYFPMAVSVLCHTEYPVNVNQLNGKNETPLHILLSAKEVNEDACIKLLTKRPDVKLDIPFPDAKRKEAAQVPQVGSYPLHQAIRLKNLKKKRTCTIKMIDQMLLNGANPNQTVKSKSQLKVLPENPLIIAIRFKDIDTVRSLLRSVALVTDEILDSANPSSTLMQKDRRFLEALLDAKKQQDEVKAGSPIKGRPNRTTELTPPSTPPDTPPSTSSSEPASTISTTPTNTPPETPKEGVAIPTTPIVALQESATTTTKESPPT